MLQVTPAAVQSCSSDQRNQVGILVKGLNDFMTLMDAQSRLRSAQLYKQNVATSVIRGEGARARAEEGRREDAADSDDLGTLLQLWACRFGEIGTHVLQASPFPSAAGAASPVCRGFAINKMCNEAFFLPVC